MKIKFSNSAIEIIKKFKNKFLLSWDEFQTVHKDWIDAQAKTNYPINVNWYEQSYMWDKINPDIPNVTMDVALKFLREQKGLVFFIAEDNEEIIHKNKIYKNFVAEVDVNELAKTIEKEWFESYILEEQDMYDSNAFLPEDIYVFDDKMKWCVVFTHETSNWDSELTNPMISAESRICFICKD